MKQHSKLEQLLDQSALITSKAIPVENGSRYSAADQVPTCNNETEASKKELVGEPYETEANLSNEKLKVEELL